MDLPALIDSRLLIQANSGGGKSWLIRRLLEQSHGKVQQIVIDLEGEFGTLREKYDYILAGKDGDTPAEPRSAALLARKALEHKFSLIVDLYELAPQERKRFVRLFLESMINAPKELWHDVLVVIDEAHVFVPEKGESEAANAVIDLATRGRKRGFCAVLATQRISKLHKDAAAECNNKLIGRAAQDIDMKRAGEELGFTSKEQFLSLRKMAPGEFYAFGPAIADEVEKITVGKVETSHPKAGSRSLTKVVPPTENIKKILANLADLPQEAQKEAQTVAELKSKIKELEKQITFKVHTSYEPDQKTIEKFLEPHLIAFASVEQAAKNKINMWEEHLNEVRDTVNNFTISMQGLDKKRPSKDLGASYTGNRQIKVSKPIETRPASVKMPDGSVEVHNVSEKKTDGKWEIVSFGENPDLTGPEKKILNALAWCESISLYKPPQEIIAFLSGYAHVRSTGYTNPRGYLKSKGLISYESGTIYLTTDGRGFAETPNKILTQEDIHEAVMNRLPGPERKVLQPLLDRYPEAISNTELCSLSGYEHERSTGYTNPRGRLKYFGLIEYDRGMVKAKSLLFLE